MVRAMVLSQLVFVRFRAPGWSWVPVLLCLRTHSLYTSPPTAADRPDFASKHPPSALHSCKPSDLAQVPLDAEPADNKRSAASCAQGDGQCGNGWPPRGCGWTNMFVCRSRSCQSSFHLWENKQGVRVSGVSCVLRRKRQPGAKEDAHAPRGRGSKSACTRVRGSGK